MPSGLYVLGSRAGARRNLMTLNWAMQASTDPKLVAVSIEGSAVTHGLVSEGGVFALSILSREDRAVVRKFVKPLDDDGDPARLGGFEVHEATSGAPILALAAAWLDCEVREVVPCGSHTLFLGEVVDCGSSVELGSGGSDAGAGILRMEDTRMSYGG